MHTNLRRQRIPSTKAAHLKKWSLIVAACISVCVTTGCIESTFNLADESRLPKGIAIPPGLTRADVSLTLDYHTLGKAKFTLRDLNGKKLATVVGMAQGSSRYLSTAPRSHDLTVPAYDVVVINGVTEVIKDRPYQEHENMVQNGRIVALFYVVDDPAIKEEILAQGRSVK
jgi:hypothetical protein